jgi:hypothetical protein
MPKDNKEIFELSHRLQSWRPDVMTQEFIDIETPDMPFCRKCADWHSVNDVCSMTDEIR